MRRLLWLCHIVGFLATAGPAVVRATGSTDDVESLERQLAAAQGGERLALLVQLAELRRDDADAVLALCTEALQLLATQPSPELEVHIRTARSHACEVQGRYDEAREEAERAVQVARTRTDDALLGLALYQAATIDWRMARYDTALPAAEQAVDLLASAGPTETRIRAVSLVGAIHHATGDLDRGLQGYLAALQLADSAGNAIAAARAHNNIGLVYLELGRRTEGLEAMLRALAIHDRLGPRENLANTLNNVGLALVDMDRPTEGLPYLTRVLEMDRSAANPFGQAKALSNIGYAHEKLQQLTTALDYHTQALALREQIGDRDGMVRTIGAIAEVRMRMGDPRGAIPLFERSIALAVEIQNRRDEARQLYLLAQAKADAGDTADALATFRRFHERQAALFDRGSQRRIAEMEARYQARERQRDLDNVRLLAESRRRLVVGLSMGSALLAASLFLVGALHVLRRRTRRAYAESEVRYRTLFQSSSVPTLLVNRETQTIIDLNAPARALLEVEDGVQTLPVPAIRVAPVRTALARVLASPPEVVVALDDSWTDSTGQVRWTEIRGSTVALGGHSCLLATLRDTTDTHRQDDARRQEDRVQSLGVLAGGIAHDFNNALMAILGHVSLAQDASHADRKDLLDHAEQAALGASRLARQLLTFARGGQPLRRPTSLARLLPDAIALAEAGAKASVQLDIPDGLWAADVDAGQFSQVVANLVINALEATNRRGHVLVRASNFSGPCEPGVSTDATHFVRIDVEDDGPGIASTLQHRVFDPYFTTKPGGHGLGLATAHSICRHHGGTLRLTSREGAGSTFSAFFPAAAESTPAPVPTPFQRPDGCGTILVLDDEPLVRRVLQRMLVDWGYVVEECADGADAVLRYRERAAQGTPFDLLIMDLTIPGGMGGRQAMAEILAFDPTARAIVASGYADDPTMAAFREAGFQAALAKPFRRDELGRTITAILGRTSLEG